MVVDGTPLVDALLPDAAHGVFGPPDRIEPAGEPAPYGHRNTQIHFYDALGVFLHEHHDTGQVHSIGFVFRPLDAIHAPATAFAGTFELGCLRLSAETRESDLHRASFPLKPWLAGSWSAKDSIHVAVRMVRPRTPAGRPSKVRRLVSVHAGLRHDPWMKG